MLNSSRLWIAAVVLYTTSTFAVSSLQNTEYIPRFKYIRVDWMLHALEYGMLAVLVSRYHSVSMHKLRTMRNSLITLAYCGVIGLLNELWQSRIPNRSPDWGDAIANVIGALLAVFVFNFLKQNKLKT